MFLSTSTMQHLQDRTHLPKIAYKTTLINRIVSNTRNFRKLGCKRFKRKQLQSVWESAETNKTRMLG